VIVIVDPSEDQRKKLASVADGLGEVVPATDLPQAALAVERAPLSEGRVVVIGPGIARADALLFAGQAERDARGVATLITATSLQADLLREALRSGVADVLTVDATDDEWRDALKLAHERSATSAVYVDPREHARGRVVAVFSTKGGTGKSFISCNLAAIAAQRFEKAALVDLDLHSGDVALMYQMMPALTVHDVAAASDSLDEQAMRGYLIEHGSGVSVLAAPQDLTYADEVLPEAITAIVRQLAEMFPVVVIDGPPVFTDQMLAALDVADEIVVVGAMDVPTIKNLNLALATLIRLGQPREKLRVVLNRADSRVGLNIAEVEKSLGTTIDVEIPSSRDVPLSINEGTPITLTRPRSSVSHALNRLADVVLPATSSRGRGSRFLRR
jgi:pilus assembly protein CpaE